MVADPSGLGAELTGEDKVPYLGPVPVAAWKVPSDAYWTGFNDGYHGIMDAAVPEFHSAYELGFILGWAARRGKW